MAFLAIAVPGASAAPAHPALEVFGSAQQPELGKPSGIAIDPATGDLYVIDLEDQTLHRFKPNGEPDPFSALSGSNVIDGHAGGADEVPGVHEILATEVPYAAEEAQVTIAPPGSAGNTAGDIYVTNGLNGQIDIFSSSGAFIASKTSSFPCGVSVGPGGEVFVGDFEDGVYKWIPTAPGTLTPAAGSPFPAPEACNVAAGYGSSAGSVYYSALGQKVFKLNASTGAPEGEVFAGPSRGGISIDPGTGHLYIAVEQGAITTFKEFSATGTEVSSTPVPAAPAGVAVNGTSGDVYVTQAGNPKLEVFGPLQGKERGLSIAIVGTGVVECKDEGDASFGPCKASYGEGHVVKLRASSIQGSHFSFSNWSEFSGSGSVTTPCAGPVVECEVRLSGAVTGKATFVANPEFRLTVTKSGSGTGSISSVPGGINCGSECEASYESTKTVTLEATPAANSVFVEWTGACAGSGFCHVEMKSAKSVDAVFALAQRALTVTTAGGGSGSVTCNGVPCSSRYPDGTVIALAAAPDSSSTFAGWSGAGCGGSGTCTLTIHQDSAVTATFEKKAEKPPAPPKVPGVASVQSPATVKGAQASVKLTCSSVGSCEGKITLKYKAKQGKKTKTVVVGSASFSLSAGQSKTIKVKIANAQVKQSLSKGNAVSVVAEGPGLKSSKLNLKPSRSKH
jgi:DNA-binding beta-propeller fold protein YncE